ncbi:Uncharacterised protein [Bordetella pertussis]|nr:Uncharacterised protein [Bordetella pertussis]
MPRCASTKLKSCATPWVLIFSTSSLRIRRMRSRMPASSFSQSANSSGVFRTVDTTVPPWVGGLE